MPKLQWVTEREREKGQKECKFEREKKWILRQYVCMSTIYKWISCVQGHKEKKKETQTFKREFRCVQHIRNKIIATNEPNELSETSKCKREREEVGIESMWEWEHKIQNAIKSKIHDTTIQPVGNNTHIHTQLNRYHEPESNPICALCCGKVKDLLQSASQPKNATAEAFEKQMDIKTGVNV